MTIFNLKLIAPKAMPTQRAQRDGFFRVDYKTLNMGYGDAFHKRTSAGSNPKLLGQSGRCSVFPRSYRKRRSERPVLCDALASGDESSIGQDESADSDDEPHIR